jgi:transaldolase
MTRLQRLYAEHGQSPWLDNLTRGHLHSGALVRLVEDGIRGVTANPTIFARAIQGSSDYDEQFASLTAAGCSIDEAYWELVVSDVTAALAVLRPVFDHSNHADGFVSVEVAPQIAYDTQATIAAARALHERIAQPNLFVKIPATAQGVPAVEAMTAEGRSVNVTLIFSLARYAQIVEAYLSGLETFTAAGGDAATVHSVASFFVSRVDTEVDRRLDVVGTDAAARLRGQAALAQAKLAYVQFRSQFSGRRWERLAGLGAHLQRPLWASTSTKDPAYADTRYVDELIGPDTVNTLPEPTIAAFEDHGRLSRTVDARVEEAGGVMQRLAATGLDMDDVGLTLEAQGVAGFTTSFDQLLAELHRKARQLSRR